MRRTFLCLASLLVAPAAGCTSASHQTGAIPETLVVPAGAFVRGSDRAEREMAYKLDEAAYGHSVTRLQRWYENEYARGTARTGRFLIMRRLVTNEQYLAFVSATGHRPPDVKQSVWTSYGLIHPWSRTRRHAWHDRMTPPGRSDHPVVLVSHDDARAYAEWLSRETHFQWRLPTELEWEKAARGTEGRRFPWGDSYEPKSLNSHDTGPFDTLPVGKFPEGASPFGMLDAAGQVFEWTASAAGADRFIVKGGSWDDKGCGICRPAARHARPKNLKHILIGFRLVRDR
jgi:formylglycine-generating enzyme required for sulfatase activity